MERLSNWMLLSAGEVRVTTGGWSTCTFTFWLVVDVTPAVSVAVTWSVWVPTVSPDVSRFTLKLLVLAVVPDAVGVESPSTLIVIPVFPAPAGEPRVRVPVTAIVSCTTGLVLFGLVIATTGG